MDIQKEYMKEIVMLIDNLEAAKQEKFKEVQNFLMNVA